MRQDLTAGYAGIYLSDPDDAARIIRIEYGVHRKHLSVIISSNGQESRAMLTLPRKTEEAQGSVRRSAAFVKGVEESTARAFADFLKKAMEERGDTLTENYRQSGEAGKIIMFTVAPLRGSGRCVAKIDEVPSWNDVTPVG